MKYGYWWCAKRYITISLSVVYFKDDSYDGITSLSRLFMFLIFIQLIEFCKIILVQFCFAKGVLTYSNRRARKLESHINLIFIESRAERRLCFLPLSQFSSLVYQFEIILRYDDCSYLINQIYEKT